MARDPVSNLWQAMESAGWYYDRRTNSFRKGEMTVEYMRAEQAWLDADRGIDRSAPANDDGGGDAEADS